MLVAMETEKGHFHQWMGEGGVNMEDGVGEEEVEQSMPLGEGEGEQIVCQGDEGQSSHEGEGEGHQMTWVGVEYSTVNTYWVEWVVYEERNMEEEREARLTLGLWTAFL